MSRRDRRDSDGRDRDRRDGDRRDWQDDEGQQRRTGEGEVQEGDSLIALKAILSRVAAQLKPLNLSADESIRLVEQLYGSVLDMDSAMAGEADDTRKSSTLAYIQNTTIRRDADKLVVRFPTAEDLQAAEAAAAEATLGAAPAAQQAPTQTAPAAAPARESVPVTAPAGEAAPTEPRRAGGPRPAPRKERGETASGTEAREGAGALPQQPRIDSVEGGPRERREPEGPEA